MIIVYVKPDGLCLLLRWYLSFKSFVNFRLGCTILEECRWFFDNGIIIMTTTDILPET